MYSSYFFSIRTLDELQSSRARIICIITTSGSGLVPPDTPSHAIKSDSIVVLYNTVGGYVCMFPVALCTYVHVVL